MAPPAPGRPGCRLLVLPIPLWLAGCGAQSPQPQPQSRVYQSLDLHAVDVMSVPRYYAVPGSVIADERVQLSSRISGFIRRLAVREGDRVREGQVLVEIDPADVEGAVQRASATVASAQAELADARSMSKNSRP